MRVFLLGTATYASAELASTLSAGGITPVLIEIEGAADSDSTARAARERVNRRIRLLLTSAGVASAISVEAAMGAIKSVPPAWRGLVWIATLGRHLTGARTPVVAATGAAEPIWLNPNVDRLPDKLAAAGCSRDDIVLCQLQRVREVEVLADLTIADRNWRGLRLFVSNCIHVGCPASSLQIWREALNIAYDRAPVWLSSWRDSVLLEALQTSIE